MTLPAAYLTVPKGPAAIQMYDCWVHDIRALDTLLARLYIRGAAVSPAETLICAWTSGRYTELAANGSQQVVIAGDASRIVAYIWSDR